MRNATSEANIASARDLTFHGMNALHQGESGQAESLLAQAVQACPDDQRIRQHLASAMVEQGKLDEAIAQLETALEHSHHDPRLLVELGNLHLLKQQPGQAMQYADAALRINRQIPCGWILKGRCEAARNSHESALASFHRAAGLNDVPAEVQVYLAETYRTMQRPMQALSALEVYSENFGADQMPMDAVMLMAETLVDLNQTQRAADQLAQATGRSDATSATWIALSQIQELAGDPSAALMTARNAVTVFPNDRDIQAWTASLVDETRQQGSRTAALPKSNGFQRSGF